MRGLLVGGLCFLVLTGSVYLAGLAQQADVKVQIQILDGATGKPLAGLVRVVTSDRSKTMELPGLYDRLKSLEKTVPIKGWYVVPEKGATTILPSGSYLVEAMSGLETTKTVQPIEITQNKSNGLNIKVKSLFPLQETKLVAGNTHLHLRNMTKAQAEEYIKAIPPGDGLKVLFLSYLERHKDDETYITNQFPLGDLKQFDVTGVLINNGEEHRHNFKGYGQGFGHVMFLDIQKLVKPVSIGPGIMATGFDDSPLRPGIDDAKKQGGTVIWCHNTFGYEDVLNALTGRLDALNVFDGSRNDTYEENYYRYLNIGLRLPITTGTDWFMYDFSRVYAQVPDKLTIKSWLQAVKAGRCQATNGPLLSLTVEGKGLGEVIRLDKAKPVKIEAKCIGRQAFGKLELIHNGKVVKSQSEQKQLDHFTAQFQHQVPMDQPGWFAVRVSSGGKNEFEQTVYAHTSPVYVELGGQKCFDVESAKALLKQVEEGKAAIQAQGTFSIPQARESLLALYDQAAADLAQRINQKK